MDRKGFDTAFERLTGNLPFPWQWKLYAEWFAVGKFPESCNLPTGLGKTAVIPIWLLALATAPAGKVPRRLVYVVNRRTVVDQSTREAEKVREQLPNVPEIFNLLREKCATKSDEPGWSPLAISTLRGQFADNREWSADPTRPAVIVGTVDMIGSRLLFSGYGIGFKAKPLHAGFLGQDSLLVHDEAHLEPAFQKLIEAIRDEQHDHERTGELPWPKLRVMELSATTRGNVEPFRLTDEESNPLTEESNPPTTPLQIVWQRIAARKEIAFREAKRSEVAKEIGSIARGYNVTFPGNSILVFVRSVESVETVRSALTDKKKGGVPDDQVRVLTGTLRGLERDRLVREDPIYARFLLKTPSDGKTVYLICTSAGEVGIDISADHLVCDLAPLDNLAQRLGRVNRRGTGKAQVDVVCESDPEKPKPDMAAFETARWLTYELLQRLPSCEWTEGRREGSPKQLGKLIRELSEAERTAAFAPQPTVLLVTDILFDSWALTTIRGKLPGRPMVEPYLHGISEWEPPETQVAWREEVGTIVGPLLEQYKPVDLLEDYPLKPHELLRDRSDRVFKQLVLIADRHPDDPVWLLDDAGNVEELQLKELADKDRKDRINYRTVILPVTAGGLRSGILDDNSSDQDDLDVSDKWFEDAERMLPRRTRIRTNDPKPARLNGMRLILEIDMKADIEEDESENGDEDEENGSDSAESEQKPKERYWRWYVRPWSADDDGSKTAQEPVTWNNHTKQVSRNMEKIVAKLHLPPELQDAAKLAANFHDLGKCRDVWQRSIGNPDPKDWHAKSGKGWKPIKLSSYRHEFGSLLDALGKDDFMALKDKPEVQELILHLIAVHHGYGRPHFPEDLAFDPEPKGRNASDIAAELPRRFGRLQRKYGRWGLAYLESLLRAADYDASANPSSSPEGDA